MIQEGSGQLISPFESFLLGLLQNKQPYRNEDLYQVLEKDVNETMDIRRSPF